LGTSAESSFAEKVDKKHCIFTMLMDLYKEKYGPPQMTMEELKKIRNDKKKNSERSKR
jgi:hypothetical protein